MWWLRRSLGYVPCDPSLGADHVLSCAVHGMLAAGYNLISAGGSTYPHQGLPPRWNSTNDSNIINVIVRNSSGYYEIDPARFPGPGSSPECLDAATLRACLANHSKNGRSWSSGDPATCGCKNGNAGMAALSSFPPSIPRCLRGR